jgi:hypothetical protein
MRELPAGHGEENRANAGPGQKSSTLFSSLSNWPLKGLFLEYNISFTKKEEKRLFLPQFSCITYLLALVSWQACGCLIHSPLRAASSVFCFRGWNGGCAEGKDARPDKLLLFAYCILVAQASRARR